MLGFLSRIQVPNSVKCLADDFFIIFLDLLLSLNVIIVMFDLQMLPNEYTHRIRIRKTLNVRCTYVSGAFL